MLAANNQIRFLTPAEIQPHKPLFAFLPGMDGAGHLLQWQIGRGLADAFDIRCLTIPPDDLSSWDVLADKVAELLLAELGDLGDRRRLVYLCGESFGGCLALRLATLVPCPIDRLILVNPASCFNRRPWMQWGSYMTGWLPPPFYPFAVMGFWPFLASLGRMARTHAQDLLAAMQAVNQQSSAWRVALMREFEIGKTQLRRITLPALVIASGHDSILSSLEESQRLTQYIPNAKRVVLPQSGHTCLLETDVNLYAILKEQDFLP